MWSSAAWRVGRLVRVLRGPGRTVAHWAGHQAGSAVRVAAGPVVRVVRVAAGPVVRVVRVAAGPVVRVARVAAGRVVAG
jgi:hypothetical protein